MATKFHFSLLPFQIFFNIISSILKSGRIAVTRAPPYITVAKNSHNKARRILNLRYLNSFVYKSRIKFKDWTLFNDIFDISQGYHQIVSIRQESPKILALLLKIDSKIMYVDPLKAEL